MKWAVYLKTLEKLSRSPPKDQTEVDIQIYFNIKFLSNFVLKESVCYAKTFRLIKLKSDSHLPKKTLFICFNDSPSKMMKNAFYFILKALFILNILKCLSWLFGHVEETAWLER